MKYIDPTVYTSKLLEYKRTGKCSEKLGQIFLKHTQNVLWGCERFRRYSLDWKHEMRTQAIIRLLKLKNSNFDPDKGNAWSYCEEVIRNSFFNTIKKIEKIV